MLALQLNVYFSDASVIAGATKLGSLHICGYSTAAVNNLTVEEFYRAADVILGGGSASFGVETATTVASLINNAFVDGAPSSFAQASLVNGACP